eukprot:TRINITY_DN106409_c0_g1_i1.p1 TRINITY_DN106409_c0_g1~~TRINITY_DN106409_c0_g1_i1.p1  ORF type:complete len:409 (+),score=75.55 TRINITY_DN106409_c0_g1_i1:60-1286(+)
MEAVQGSVTPSKAESIKNAGMRNEEEAAGGDSLDTPTAAEADLASIRKQLLKQVRDASIPTVDEFCDFETYIFDCDGVIWGIDESDTKTAVATINILLGMGKRVMFVTNNSNKRRADFVAELERKGIDFGVRDAAERLRMVISASFTTANYLKQNRLKHPFVIASDTGILEELKLVGISEKDYFATITDDGQVRSEFESPLLYGAEPEIHEIIEAHPQVDCIVVGWDLGITARKVGTAINYIRWHEDMHCNDPGYCQMPIIASSGDAGGVLGKVQHRGQSVKLRAIGNGAMADIIARSFDPPLEWLDMGKPSDALIELLRSPEGYNVNPHTALMIGDTLQTDIVFGNRAGMKTLLVMTGVTTMVELQGTLASWANVRRRPTFVLPKLGSLLHALKAPNRGGSASSATG